MNDTTKPRAMLPQPTVAEVTSLPNVVWEIAGALVMGAVIGAGVSLYLRFIQKQLLIFGIIVAILGTEVARLAHVELLLTLLTAGFVMETSDRAIPVKRYGVPSSEQVRLCWSCSSRFLVPAFIWTS